MYTFKELQINDEQFLRLKQHAEAHHIGLAKAIRQLIDSLPNQKEPKQTHPRR